MHVNCKITHCFYTLVAPLLDMDLDKPVRRAVAVYHLALLPIHWAGATVHKRFAHIVKSKRVVKLTMGTVIAGLGAYMAHHPIALIPLWIWDAFSYGLHGYGALPFIKVACKALDLENLDEG